MYLKRDVAWLLIWISISSAGRNRLAKIENKVDNIAKTTTSVNKLKVALSNYVKPYDACSQQPLHYVRGYA